MKALLTLLFILPLYFVSIQANVDVETTYKEGITAYEKGDFTKSYKSFKKIYLKQLANSNFNFYFGKSAYETGHYETALAAFERVEIQDSSNLVNKLEMARTYYMLKMFEDSENAFKEVLANPNIPDNVRRSIELSLSRVSKVQQNSFTYATVALDLMYDSNVNYGSARSYTFRGLQLEGADDLSDMGLQAYANITNIYDIGSKNGFAIKNSFNFYLKDYQKYDAYNILYIGYNPSLIYQDPLYTAELELGIDTMQLHSKKFLSTASIKPKFEFVHSPTLRSFTHFKFQRKDFERTEQNGLDANRFELLYGLQNILSPRSYVQGNLLGAKEKKLHGQRIDVDFNEYKFDLTYVNQFSQNYGLELYGHARDRKYNDASSGFGSTREDLDLTGSVGLTRTLMPSLILKLKTSLQSVNSNQEVFTYKKYTATAGIIKTF